MDKDAKESRNRRIFELWLACWTQKEIADECDCSQQEVDKQIKSFTTDGTSAIYGKTQRAAAEHATDFDPPIYNIWNQQKKSNGSSYFGNTEIRWLDNLLYLYTEPFDIVIDPFAGGGSTIDVPRCGYIFAFENPEWFNAMRRPSPQGKRAERTFRQADVFLADTTR